MIDRQLIVSLISNLLGANVAAIPTDHGPLDALSASYSFSANLQPMFTPETLDLLLDSVKDNIVYQICDPLDICLSFFRLENTFYLIGPYVEYPYSAHYEQRIQKKYFLPLSEINRLRFYHTALPVVTVDRLQDILIAGCLRAFSPNGLDFSFRVLHGLPESDTPEHTHAFPEADQFEQIYARYSVENKFMQAFRSGDVTEVMKVYHMMSSVSTMTDAENLQTASSPTSGLVILRTLSRKAAEQAGLSVLKIHEITQRHIQLVSTASTTAESAKYTTDMIVELVEAIREQRTRAESYSEPISAVLGYLDYNCSRNISASDLAKFIHLSESHLSRLFREETGRTISQALAEIRCRKAADLLRGTDRKIQDISAYVGYPDNNYFVKVFKKYYGVTPSEFRDSKE